MRVRTLIVIINNCENEKTVRAPFIGSSLAFQLILYAQRSALPARSDAIMNVRYAIAGSFSTHTSPQKSHFAPASNTRQRTTAMRSSNIESRTLRLVPMADGWLERNSRGERALATSSASAGRIGSLHMRSRSMLRYGALERHAHVIRCYNMTRVARRARHSHSQCCCG